MEYEWLLFIAAGAVAFGVTMALTPVSKTISVKLGAIDYPRKRGMHGRAIPRLGGVAIIAGFFAAMAVMAPFNEEIRSVKFLGFMAGALIIAALGMVDDIRSVKAGRKFIIQLIAASIVAATGTRIQFISLFNTPFGDLLKSFDVVITILWIVGVTNAVNLIDGIDGLAAGVSGIAAICLTALCIMSGTPTAVMFAATIAGSCLGFLPRNFSPAEVIMGDTGATFLGFALAVSSILGVFKSYAILSVVIAILAMALPILDTAFAMLRRMATGRPVMSADRGHLHHRLVDAGFTHKQAVVILYFISIVGAIIAFLIAKKDLTTSIIVGVSLIVAVSMALVYFRRLKEANGKTESELDEVSKVVKKPETAGFELSEDDGNV